MLASFDGLMPPKTLSFVSSAAASSSSPRPRDIPPRVCPSECAAPRTPKVWSRRGILTLGEKAIPRAIRWVLGHVMKNEITLAAAPLDDESPLVGLLRVLAEAELGDPGPSDAVGSDVGGSAFQHEVRRFSRRRRRYASSGVPGRTRLSSAAPRTSTLHLAMLKRRG